MSDIAASLRKKLALDQSFGMGAKVAGLGSNRLGMRYRSCRDGRVAEIIIGERDGAFGRVLYPTPGGPVDVRDATEAATADGRDASFDWTEVVLLGQRPDQDTVANPYDSDLYVARNWIVEGLFCRHWRLPNTVEIIVEAGLHQRQGDWRFRPLSQRPDEGGAIKETVTDRDGVKVTYLYAICRIRTSPGKTCSAARSSRFTTACWVWRIAGSCIARVAVLPGLMSRLSTRHQRPSSPLQRGRRTSR